MKAPPIKRDICGQDAGYQKHYRMEEESCAPCLEAHRALAVKYNKQRSDAKRSSLAERLEDTPAINVDKIEEQLAELGATHFSRGAIISKAHCVGRTNLLFPDEGDYSAARALCTDCPMQQPCRTTGVIEILLGETPMGMYGGRTPDELRQDAMPILAELRRGEAELELRLVQILCMGVELSKSVYGPQNHITKLLRDLHMEVENNGKWWTSDG